MLIFNTTAAAKSEDIQRALHLFLLPKKEEEEEAATEADDSDEEQSSENEDEAEEAEAAAAEEAEEAEAADVAASSTAGAVAVIRGGDPLGFLDAIPTLLHGDKWDQLCFFVCRCAVLRVLQHQRVLLLLRWRRRRTLSHS